MVDLPYQNPYVDPYPGASQNAIDMRRRYALGVLQQAGDGTPTKANAIGAIARALQGAMGGYLAGQVDQSDLADKAKTQALVQQLIGGGASAPGAPDATAPQAAGTSAPMPPTDASLPRGLRNNNPLNIEAGGFTQSQPGFAGSDGRFARFATPDAGIAAASKLLDTYQNKYGLNTPAGIVGRWAPAADGNNVSAYAADVAGKLGIGPNDPIPPQMRPQLIAAMAQHENGRPLPPTMLAGPVPTPDSQPVAQAAPPTAPQPPVPPAGNPDRAAIIAQLLATRSGGQIGSSLAGALINQQIAPPEFKQIGQDVLGRPSYGWVSPQKQTVTPVGGAGNAANGGAAPGADASFTQIQSAVAKGASPSDVYQYVPVELREAVKSIVEGRGVPTNLGTRGNARNAAMMYAHAVDPSFDEALIPQRMTFARSMGSMSPSAVGGQKVLLGTSLGHLADLSDSAVDMGNSNGMGLAPLAHGYNAVMNQGTDQSAKALALEDKAQKFSGEVGKLYSGSAGGGVHEREETRSRIGATKSPAELAAGLEANRDLILSKLQSLEEQRDAAFGRNGPKVIEFQTPQVKAALARIQSNIDKLRGNTGAASAASPSAQLSAPVTKSIGGKTYVQQNGQWYEQ